MEKEYKLSKKELEIEFIKKVAKYNKLKKIEKYISRIAGTIALVNTIIMIANIVIVNHVHIGYILSFLTPLGVVLISEKYLDKKQEKIVKQYQNIQNQLDDIVSMEFEKKSYALEKNNSNISCNNDLIKNIQEEKELLEKYKQDLNYYSIDRVDEELSNEIDSRNYALLKLNQLK